MSVIDTSVYATPRIVDRIDDCWFYHTMDLPGIGTVNGRWDLRGHENEYLGNIPLARRRVLEIGPASGHLSFHMERCGAQVVSCELSPEMPWDLVPLYGVDMQKAQAERSDVMRRLNNSYWFAHAAFQSQARIVYCPAYAIPDTIGRFDVGIFTAVLLHFRDPFQALARVAQQVDNTIVVTEIHEGIGKTPAGAVMEFLPTPDGRRPLDTWWNISPTAISQMLTVLGFPRQTGTTHRQTWQDTTRDFYTIVAERTTVP